MNDFEKARAYFIKKYHDLSDYFGEEKYPDEIAAVKIALELIEKEMQRSDGGGQAET